ncbi:MAG: precorrin-3B C(17)-methyltransferase [Marinifilaceae bacterium]
MEPNKKGGKISVLGLGPGGAEQITPVAQETIKQADIVIGYKYYFQFIEHLVKKETECLDTGMKKERQRAEIAFELAESGKKVAVISSGDAGIYGMAPLIFEMWSVRQSAIEIDCYPGISAFQAAAAKLGAPIGHDLCTISLSDLLTPWATIEKRIEAAAYADFATSIYNPKSKGRYWQLHRLKEIFLKHRNPETPVGIVKQVTREEEQITVTTLKEFDPEIVDMFTLVVIGNSQTFRFKNYMVTPRGYYTKEKSDRKLGQSIMIQSFKTIESKLNNPEMDLDKKWALLHCIHTTADFDMENIFYADDQAIAHWHERLHSENPPAIITDVTMALSGMRKAAIERLGIKAKCYLHDERVKEMAETQGITRTQAGIRLAAEEHPDAIFVFGNAPTALIELTELIRKGKANPTGIVAAPVGFVNVVESKHRTKTFSQIPKVILEGRKGGSNLAATIINAALAYDDAPALEPGRDV